VHFGGGGGRGGGGNVVVVVMCGGVAPGRMFLARRIGDMHRVQMVDNEITVVKDDLEFLRVRIRLDIVVREAVGAPRGDYLAPPAVVDAAGASERDPLNGEIIAR
jgi:hypothetical protein